MSIVTNDRLQKNLLVALFKIGAGQEIFTGLENKMVNEKMSCRIAEKHLSQIVHERRATRHFGPAPVPEEDLQRILRAGLESPSGYNLQPWRFIVVRGQPQRELLAEAAMAQAKVKEAPLVIVACGDTEAWRSGDLEEMLRLARERNGSDEARYESIRRNVWAALGSPGDAGGIAPDLSVWINRHVMVALTTMMWMAEALGYDTAPLEGFWESKVKALLKIPKSVRVVALLAIGHGTKEDKPYGGRFDVSRTVFVEEWGRNTFAIPPIDVVSAAT